MVDEGKAANSSSTYRRLRRRLSKTVLRRPQVWLCHRFLRPFDVILGSYPRSGSTWSRFTLFQILTGREAGFKAVNEGIRPVYFGRGEALLADGGRFISTHEQYRKQYQRAIYLVRDARDVLLSEFAYTKALDFVNGDLDQFIKTFFCGKVNAFGPWQRHVKSWLDSPLAGTPNLLIVRYEDLRQNPCDEFTRIANFLGVNPSREVVQNAVARNTVDKMKEKERIEPQRASTKGSFVRSGFVEGWRSELSPLQLEFVERQAGNELSRLGYSLSARIGKIPPGSDGS